MTPETQNQPSPNWHKTTISRSSYLKGRIGWQGLRASEFLEEGPYLITGTDFRNGAIDWKSCYHVTEERYQEAKYIHVKDNDVLITKDGTIGKVAFVRDCPDKAVLNSGIFLLRCNDGSYEHEFMYHLLNSYVFSKFLDDNLAGSTIQHLYQNVFERFEFPIPDKPQQTQIATVLSTIDRAIAQTEALIAKQQRIKTGLMQDLLTKGIDENGNIRSEATHRFKDSPLGRIPEEWEVSDFGAVVLSLTDGPFGSNLKTEHYISEPGVRVLRLQNIGNGLFLDADKAWVSDQHASKLSKHEVINGDLLIASLGDEKHLFARACVYDGGDYKAIVKADVFRARCDQGKLIHSFAFRIFNFFRWRKPLYGLAQGVTRDRVNLSNLAKLKVPLPPIQEQQAISSYLDALEVKTQTYDKALGKLRHLKIGLMQDLLTGKVPVTPLLEQQPVSQT